MDRDITAFRERFNAYKNGKSVSEIYDAGLPRYGDGKNGKNSRFNKSLGGKYLHVIDNTIDYLHSQGVDPILIAGILGNMAQESGFNPDSIGPGGFAGTVQMSSDMAKEIKRAYGKVDYQTTNRFIHDAMSGNKIISLPWRNYMKLRGGYYGRTFDSAGDAAMAFGRVFERPNEKYANWELRMLSAEDALGYVNKRIGTPVEDIPTSQTAAAEYNATHQFQPWLNYHQPDYPLNNPAPTMISSMNNPDSPAFTTPELQSRRSYNNIKDVAFDIMNGKDVEDALMDNLSKNVFGGRKIGFKNGKLPWFRGGKGDGTKYLYDEQEDRWDRVTAGDVADAMSQFVVTPHGVRGKFDYENNTNPIKPLSKNAVVKSDDTLWTRQQVEKANNTRTWRSDAADIAHSIGEGAFLASTFAAPEIEPLLYQTYKTSINAAKDRMAAAIYRNIVPASYSESYMPYGKLEEVANAAADFLSPFKKLELTNERWKPWLDRRMPKGFITDATAARDEIYRKYLGLPNKDFYYIKNTDGTLSHNLKNHHWRDVLKLIDSAEYNDPMLLGTNTSSFDLINSAGGEISQSIKLISPNNAIFLYSDVWDVNPFLSPDRMGNILPTHIIKKYTHLDKNNKLVWNEDIPKYIEKLKNFELSDITNGNPQPVKTSVDVLLLNRDKYMYNRKMSDSEIIDKMAKLEFDILSELIDEWDDLLFKKIKDDTFQRSMKAFLENPDKFRGIFNTPEPYSDQELYDTYGYFLRKFKNGKSPIHINPANRGKFNATKKRTGKTTEELSHSKNPLTRKRAIFALNARKWKH